MKFNRSKRPARALLALLATSAAFPASAWADESAEISQLRAEIKALEQKIDALEQKEKWGESPAPAAVSVAAQTPVSSTPLAGVSPQVVARAAFNSTRVSIDDTGFAFASADGANFIKLHGLVQADSKWFSQDDGIANNDTFVLRRARLIFEGGFDSIFSFLIIPEFGGGGTGTSNAPVLYDANLGIAVTPDIKVVAGKFKSPIGLEMLQNDAVLLFNERSLATNLVPSRDVGLELTGSTLGGAANYTAGVLNGSADAGYTSNTDGDNNKDFVARMFFNPYAAGGSSPLHCLGFGLAGSYGLQNRTGSLTGGYKTDGQQTFFTYRSTVLPEGADWRVAPQANYYLGPFSAQAEYTVSAVTALAGATKAEVRNRAWQASIGYILTGEEASYNGYTPRNTFNWEQGNWGAWEIGLRVAQLKIDDGAFPVFADPASSASGATSCGASLNWFLSKTIRVSFDLVDTRFARAPGDKSTANPLIDQDERAFLTRVQVGF
jgi:phosphate-selective porin OprO/OprP